MMKFEKLDVWKLAISFSTDIYKLTSHFPSNELYGLTSQLRRASTSIALNIAEGSGRTTDLEFSRFIDISVGSTLECVSALHICLNLELISNEQFTSHYSTAENICKKLYSLKNYLKK
jgi:four helix bundle protein